MTATTINTFPSIHHWSSPRAWALAIIVLLHLGFFWALTSGMTQQIMKVFVPQPPVLLPQPTDPKPQDQIKVNDPVIKDPLLSPSMPLVPEFPTEPTPQEPVVTEMPRIPGDITGGGSGSVVPPAPVVVEPRIDSRRGLSEPYYPPQVIREGGEGTVVLSIYILADGRVGEVKLISSSGYSKLDDSAMREAKKWRFVAGTTDGKPMAMWKQLPVTFRLNTRM